MFEDVEVLAARLLAADPDQGGAEWEPVLDPDRSLVAELQALQRLIAAGQAKTMTILAGLCRRAQTWQDLHDPKQGSQLGPPDLVAAEIGPALHLTAGTAGIQVQRAVRITTVLAGTHAAFTRGDLDLGRVLAIDEATTPLSDADAAKVEELVLPDAVNQNAAELRAALRRAVISVDPGAAEKRRKRAVKDRSVTRYTDKDGTSVLEAVLSAVDTGEIYDLIDQLARQTKTSGDTRSMNAQRADAFVLLMLGREPHLGPEDPDEPPPPAAPSGDDQPDHPDDSPGEDPGSEGSNPDAPDPDQRHVHEPDPDQRDRDQRDLDERDLDEPDVDGPDRDGPDVDEPDVDEPDFDAELPATGDLLRDPDDPGLVDPVDPETVPPDLAQHTVNQAWRDRELTRFDTISELAALALAAMTTRRAPRLPWVAINQTTGPDGELVLVGELQGYGPITAEYAEHLLATGAARAPDGPTGREPTRAQASTHDPPAWLDREIRARDGTCRFPGCRQPAHRIDLDHVIPFPRGLTVRTNLGGLCRRHHRLKTAGYWHVEQHENGIYEWTSMITGATYTTYPRGSTGEWRGTTNHQ